jgi:hypothetical protein
MLIFSDTVVITLCYPTNNLSSALTNGTTIILSPRLYVHHRKTDLLSASLFKFNIFLGKLHPHWRNLAHGQWNLIFTQFLSYHLGHIIFTYINLVWHVAYKIIFLS